jgi:glycine/D-amino acid oxidase-like deaminating enzyme
MQTSVLIVGQGLCGTWLSYWLHRSGVDCLVLDEFRTNTSTRIASGVINPVTGRRMARTWLADEVIPFADKAYTEMGNHLGSNLSTPLIQRCDIIDFFNSPDRRIAFEKRATQLAEYLLWPEDEHQYSMHFHYGLGFGVVSPSYQVDLQSMLDGWRSYLVANGKLLDARFHPELLQLEDDGIQYEGIRAAKIVFCDGYAAATSGYFQLLPFAPIKGEALVLKIEGLPANHIYKKGSSITPWRGGLFWAGSTYEHNYENEEPTAAFRNQMEAWLRSFLKHDFEVVDHLAAIRPATVERRPFCGWHPQHKAVGILNGTGTKGVTLAPFFAKQLAENIAHQTPIMPEVNVGNYARVLNR